MENAQFDAITQTFKDTNLNEIDLKNLFAGIDPDTDISRVRHWASGKGVSYANFDKAHKLWRIVTSLGEYPRDVEHYVALFAKARGLSVGFDGTIKGHGTLGRRPDSGSVERDIRLLAQKLELPAKIAKQGPISDAFNKYITTQKDARIAEVVSKVIVPAVPAGSDWEALATAIVDTDQVSVGYAVAVLKATIWQVKRKLVADPAYPVTDHLMVILTGPQRAGKSTMARSFFSPIDDLMYCGDFAQITDKSNFEIWRYPVIFCDEMERAERSDIEAVKNAITSQTRTGRTLYSNNTSTRLNDATFFGATNGTLGEKIVDTTGLRRFAPIPVKSPPTDENKAAGLPVVDWSAVDAVDYMRLWQSVDYMAAHPLQSDADALAEWKALIEGERAQDSVEAWLRQFEPETGETARSWQGKDLYPRYKRYCEDNGYKPAADNTLGRRMRSFADARASWFPFQRGRTKAKSILWLLKGQAEAKAIADQAAPEWLSGSAEFKASSIAFQPRTDIAAIVSRAPTLMDDEVR